MSFSLSLCVFLSLSVFFSIKVFLYKAFSLTFIIFFFLYILLPLSLPFTPIISIFLLNLSFSQSTFQFLHLFPWVYLSLSPSHPSFLRLPISKSTLHKTPNARRKLASFKLAQTAPNWLLNATAYSPHFVFRTNKGLDVWVAAGFSDTIFSLQFFQPPPLHFTSTTPRARACVKAATDIVQLLKLQVERVLQPPAPTLPPSLFFLHSYCSFFNPHTRIHKIRVSRIQCDQMARLLFCIRPLKQCKFAQLQKYSPR